MPDLGQLLTSVLNNYLEKSAVGTSVASLDNGKVPASQLPNDISDIPQMKADITELKGKTE